MCDSNASRTSGLAPFRPGSSLPTTPWLWAVDSPWPCCRRPTTRRCAMAVWGYQNKAPSAPQSHPPAARAGCSAHALRQDLSNRERTSLPRTASSSSKSQDARPSFSRTASGTVPHYAASSSTVVHKSVPVSAKASFLAFSCPSRHDRPRTDQAGMEENIHLTSKLFALEIGAAL